MVISMQTCFITHLDMNQSRLKQIYPAKYSDIFVKDNSYIGANTTILPGVVVNHSALIASGAVVAKEVPEFTLVGGVPAKVIKKINVNSAH